MSFGAPSPVRPLVTLVLRLWRTGSSQQSQAFHFQVTHVQTGEVVDFRSLESVTQHIERLAQSVVKPPIDLSAVIDKRRSKHG